MRQLVIRQMKITVNNLASTSDTIVAEYRSSYTHPVQRTRVKEVAPGVLTSVLEHKTIRLKATEKSNVVTFEGGTCSV